MEKPEDRTGQGSPPREHRGHDGKRKKRSRSRVAAVLLVGLALVLVTAYIMYRRLFQVTAITATASAHYTAETLAAAAGIPDGTCLYSFSSKDVAARIRRCCPYVRTVKVTRKAPDKVSLTVTEDTAQFRAVVFGEEWALSQDLRVLERVKGEPEASLLRLKLPGVREAIAGSVLVFRSEAEGRYVTKTLQTVVGAALFSRLDSVDLRDRNDLVMICDGLYRMEFGPAEDTDVKLRIAEAILKDDMFRTGSRAILYLETTGKPSVILDNDADLD